ncbi:2-amino-4-hydroxy-6-hydroxymethyldihydropteridine diphosphokinase [Notoacmeibacter sp. MSK16QG-6]|uniref:2-amino-4-hydroxy-6- hydroxymethyldihydropteridine diphosphokinase n=1 Tax=Notoacmeibacter sp. MSK16QG-6 TaxID=2957982 RepID=UPI00209FCA47|nr:2-amino-4-hydroxy-6-hydroxymethyldihydropteridine diphosphokinase [Notoacmeibacter sp. MSK16QG-6]MCP1197907.1 2-amino-4-hydroxy-6-hydroxymethyldihydropteridine diphosphokinase [Notoacmeibacter sp. MSK16QG-6]
MPGRSEEPTDVLIGLGGNLGDPKTAFLRALRRLKEEGSLLAVNAVSSLWRTPPWGLEAQPDYLNACVRGTTSLSAKGLLSRLLEAESAEGRVRNVRWGPRSIDLDLLFFGDRSIDEDGLTLPHPRIAERAFVLLPLSEIAPEWIYRGETIQSLAARADTAGMTVIAEPDEWWPGE